MKAQPRRPISVRHPSPATLIATIALLVAVGGTGWAATRLDGSQLVNRSVSHTKLKRRTITGAEVNKRKLGKVPSANRAADALRLGGFPASGYTENVWATQTSAPMTLAGANKQFATLIQQPFVNDSPHASGFLNYAEVNATNNGKTPVVLTLRLSVDGHLEPGQFAGTIPPGATESLFALLKCDGMSPGHHSIRLVGRSDGPLQLGTRADDGLRPIVIPPSGSTFTGEG